MLTLCPIIDLNLLTENDEKILDKVNDDSEIWKALKKIPTNKTPGLDGLSVEFYQTKNFGLNSKFTLCIC